MQCCLASVQQFKKARLQRSDVPRTFLTKERCSNNSSDYKINSNTSIHAHYGGDMAIETQSDQKEAPLVFQGADRSFPTLVETLDVAIATFYPGIYVAVKTLLTYPVSACTAECTFSSMKRLKTPL